MRATETFLIYVFKNIHLLLNLILSTNMGKHSGLLYDVSATAAKGCYYNFICPSNQGKASLKWLDLVRHYVFKVVMPKSRFAQKLGNKINNSSMTFNSIS